MLDLNQLTEDLIGNMFENIAPSKPHRNEHLLPKVFGYKHRYRLRWRFDFANKPSKVGVWNGASDLLSDKAAFVDKTGLIRAAIEVEDRLGCIVKPLVEVDGHRYASAKWLTATNLPAFFRRSKVTSMKRQPAIIGLQFLTDSHKVSAFVDGSVSFRDLTDHEKKFNLEEHKLGV